MTAVRRCCAATDVQQDNPDCFGLASPRPVTRVRRARGGGTPGPHASAAGPYPAKSRLPSAPPGAVDAGAPGGRALCVHGSLQNRKERGFTQRPQPIILAIEIWKSTGPTWPASRIRDRSVPGGHGHHAYDSTRREIPCDNPGTRRQDPREPRLMIPGPASLRSERVIGFSRNG